MAKDTKQTCFVISPIGDEGTAIRKRSDQILEYVIKPPVEACGFDPIRADQISEPGMITSQVLQHIVNDPLVVADLTGMNANVFYELAVRHSIPKPFVQIIQKGEKIPFDVAGMRTVEVNHENLDSVAEAKKEIQKQVKAVIKKKPKDIESPISVSLELQFLRSSENPEQRAVADFVSAVSDIRSSITEIKARLSLQQISLPLTQSPWVHSLSSELERIYDIMSNIKIKIIKKERKDPFMNKFRNDILLTMQLVREAMADLERLVSNEQF